MSKKQIKLDIPTPCHEDWNTMTATESGKFCAACQKTVVDFSRMSDTEIIHYFSDFKGETCGRLTEKQLNSVIAEPLVLKPNYRWAWALSALLLPTAAASQTVKNSVVTEIRDPSVLEAKSDENGLPIEGEIKELGTNLPLGNALISIVIKDKIIATTNSNSKGLFTIELPQLYENQAFTLIVERYKMETQTLQFSNYAAVLNSQLFVAMEKIKATDLIKLHGVVVDSLNEPLPFVMIILKGKKVGMQTNFDGRFELQFPLKANDNQTIEIEAQLAGFETHLSEINVFDTNKELVFKLKENQLLPLCSGYKVPIIRVDNSNGGLTQEEIARLPTRNEPIVGMSGGISVIHYNFFQRTKYFFKNLFRKKKRD